MSAHMLMQPLARPIVYSLIQWAAILTLQAPWIGNLLESNKLASKSQKYTIILKKVLSMHQLKMIKLTLKISMLSLLNMML